MIPHILTLNASSSSIKFGLYRLPDGAGNEPPVIARGLVDGIGAGPWIKVKNASGAVVADRALPEEANHADGLEAALGCLSLDSNAVVAVGHRVAHGAPAFPKPTVIDQRVFAQLAGYTLAPAAQSEGCHGGPESLSKGRAGGLLRYLLPPGQGLRQRRLRVAARALPRGYPPLCHHGLSCDYVSGALRKIAPRAADGRVVIAHLGNGASMCALSGGRSVETTMGFSALDGLPMGTRCGQIDPGIVLYLMEVKRLDIEEIETILYRESGLKGISGLTNDMRDLEAAGTPEAEEAIAYLTSMIRREIAGMAATLGGLDAVVFCGGIGENSAEVRRRVIEPLGWLGVALDAGKNATRGETCISTSDSNVAVYVIPTDEEIVIGRACLAFLPELAGA
jgi:acetate kinase